LKYWAFRSTTTAARWKEAVKGTACLDAGGGPEGLAECSSSAIRHTGYPSNFLVDPNGVIIARDLRGTALEKKLAE